MNLSEDHSHLNWESPLSRLFKSQRSKTVQLLSQAGISRLYDLLWIRPLRIHQVPNIAPFSYAQKGLHFLGEGKIVSLRKIPAKKRFKKGPPLKHIQVLVKDIYGPEVLKLSWFNTYPGFAEKLEEKQYIRFLGLVREHQNRLEIVTPQIQSEESSLVPTAVVEYPTLNSIDGKKILDLMQRLPEFLWEQLQDCIPHEVLEHRKLISLPEAFMIVHGKTQVSQMKDQSYYHKALTRLIYEEFFQEQAKIFARKTMAQQGKAPSFKISNSLLDSLLQSLPFPPTADQQQAIIDICQDLAGPSPMMRLIQGEVGSGKTLVALLTCLLVNYNQYQAAFMCPTETLALQQYVSTKKLFPHIKCELLLGKMRNAEKSKILQSLQSGEIELIFGTHSLIQDKVSFKKLGLVVIDEQHKFGVEQRHKLIAKGETPHCLIMTATPIPRSLCMTHFGHLDISLIKSLPSGRKGTKTRIVVPENFSKFLNFVQTRLEMGEQAYIVVPAIEEGQEDQSDPDSVKSQQKKEKAELHNLERVYKRFADLFSHAKLGQLHGRMQPEEKQEVFHQFSQKKIDLLISTSVVEVGINVPNATIMAIMNPERFGLSSLHQLRGRVGRGNLPGFCFLIVDKPCGKEAMERLTTIEKCCDGFKIAEEDLRLRGEGDIFGRSQSGINSGRKLADIVQHAAILDQAREDFSALMSKNHPMIKSLLSIYTKDLKVTSTI